MVGNVSRRSLSRPAVLYWLLFPERDTRWLFRKGNSEAALASLRRSVGESELSARCAKCRRLQAPCRRPKPKALRPAHYFSVGTLFPSSWPVPSSASIRPPVSHTSRFSGNHSAPGGHVGKPCEAGDVVVKLINIVMTVIGVALIDRKGRRFLLKLGTGAVVLSLVVVAVSFYSFESKRVDVTGMIQRSIVHDSISMPMDAIFSSTSVSEPKAVTVIFNMGEGDHSRNYPQLRL